MKAESGGVSFVAFGELKMNKFHDDENDFVPGSDAHIKRLLIDLDDPYHNKDRIAVDTAKLVEFHKHEVVKQMVAYRCPPEKDKKSLSVQYATISKKKTQALLASKNAKRDPLVLTSAQHIANIEHELLEMEAEMQEREERLKNKQQQLLQPLNDVEEGEFDDYLRDAACANETNEIDQYLLDEDISEASSPYSRSARSLAKYSPKSREKLQRGGGSTMARRSMNRPQSSSAQLGSRCAADTEMMRTYHELHGERAGWRAELMAPSPVRNSSMKFLRQRTERASATAAELYKSVLDEAKLMQQKFLTCVKEANVFSSELGKGNVYRVLERDAMEDQEWSALLSRSKSRSMSRADINIAAATASCAQDGKENGIMEFIPKGTAQRIAKMLVEVTNTNHDGIRYLGTDHFFREHGRLQSEVHKKKSVVCMQLVSPVVDTLPLHASSTFSGDASSFSVAPLKSSLGVSGKPHVTPAGTFAQHMESEKQKVVAQKKTLLERRKDTEKQLQMVLSAIVTRGREIRDQIEFIKSSGWNWCSEL